MQDYRENIGEEGGILPCTS